MQTRTRIRVAGVVTTLFVVGLVVLGLVARGSGSPQDPPAAATQVSAALQLGAESDEIYTGDDEWDEESDDDDDD